MGRTQKKLMGEEMGGGASCFTGSSTFHGFGDVILTGNKGFHPVQSNAARLMP